MPRNGRRGAGADGMAQSENLAMLHEDVLWPGGKATGR